jgi:hypothetical protein
MLLIVFFLAHSLPFKATDFFEVRRKPTKQEARHVSTP